MMRAWTVARPAPLVQRPLRQVEVPVPEPGPGQVLLRVTACGVCRTDLHVVEGDLAVQRVPLVPGHQVVGTVVAAGSGVTSLRGGDRVGVAWVHRTCGVCRHCVSGRENLCAEAVFTGWTVDGGYAHHCLADAAFAHALPAGLSDLQAAPLLCAGIIGFRCLRLCGADPFPQGLSGMKLGIQGFGAAGHIAIQVARAHGAEVFVMTRDRERHQELAAQLGAAWVGGAFDLPPVPLDACICFAPAGELVPSGLDALDRGGVLVLGGIHMSDIPTFPYEKIYRERVVRSVANNTRQDAREFLAEAARIPVRTHVVPFPFERADEALLALKNDAVRGAAVLTMDEVGAP